jgi:hypothetical protein
MRTTVALDHALVRLAQRYPGVAEKTALIREALKALIEGESAVAWHPWEAQCRD